MISVFRLESALLEWRTTKVVLEREQKVESEKLVAPKPSSDFALLRLPSNMMWESSSYF